ncbi:phosphotriesterase family protein [Phytohabitans sp. LJ34]|uniref:phosphotriesterase family protein n=1 Tax=Phytohabitans sp. LJ34 TaxID=3452217 RepID=UPI003F8B619E
MPAIVTVLGEIDPADLGPTDCHEHLLIRGGLPVVLEPDFTLDSIDAAVAEVGDFRDAGGAALVDCMPLGVGRDARGLVEIAERTGATVIATTGFHRDRFYAADHWIRAYSPERIADLMVAEHTDGMETSGYGGPFVERIAARPGAIKLAFSGPEPTPTERKVAAAVAMAQRRTGLPVVTHTDDERSVALQLSILERHGVPPSSVVFGHMDRHTGVAGLVEVCRTGATVCLDWLGRHDRRPDAYVAGLVAGLASEGCLDRVVLGQDLARRGYWRAYGGGPGLANLVAAFPAVLREAGLTDDHIRQLLVDNPRRVLTRLEPS